MFAIGLVFAARGIGLTAILAMAGLSGLLLSPDALPAWLATIGDHLPVGAMANALRAAWTGRAVELRTLAALAATTVIATGVALKAFRWE